MKLYKIDFTNTIGDYMVTVPTDSQFLIGISNGDSEADVELLDGETEITPEDEKIGAYTVFKFETGETPFKKQLKATISKTEIEEETETILYTQKINIVIKCDKMSVAYRDFEGSINGATCKSLVMQNADGDVTIDIDGTNFMDVERTIFEIGTTDAQVASNTITANIDLADFPVEEGLTPMFKLNLKINCLGDAVSLPDGLMLINIKDGDNTYYLYPETFYVNYISGPTILSTVIGDSSGTSLLVELVFDVNGGYANIKGARYIQ